MSLPIVDPSPPLNWEPVFPPAPPPLVHVHVRIKLGPLVIEFAVRTLPRRRRPR